MAGELKWRYCSSVLMIVMVMLVKCIHGSRDGQLASYLREVFLDESGIALNQMVVSNESGTDYVYIGGVSTLYQLDLNLALLRQESTVPSDPTSCENPCLYDTKILEVAPAPIGKLVQCGGPEGKCEIRNLMTIAREFGYVNISLVNEGMSVGVLEITESQPLEMFLYVATSIDSNNPGRVHSPIIQFEVNILVPIRIENIREIAAIDSTVEFIQAIPWTIYNFFIVHSGTEHRRLGRLCSENLQDGLNAYSEIILSCQSYSILQSAYIDSNDVLYGVFTNGTHSALCSYAMTDIQERFVDTTCGCVISDDPSCNGTVISYLTTDAICSPSPNTNLSRESIEANYQCGDDNQMLEFSYAQATSSLEGNLLGEALPGEDSSIITLQKENTTVALVTTSSTSNTTLSKIHVFPDYTGRLYETVDLEVIGSVLTDVYINQETEELFTLTTKEVLKLAVVNCSQYKTFAGCIGLNRDGGDPFCGWCTLEQNCIRMNECTSNGSEWRQYHQKCTTNDDEATCLELDYPSEGIECLVPSFPAELLTPMSECLPGAIPSGTVCNYTCEDGYSLIGVDSIFCSIYIPVFVLPSCEDDEAPILNCLNISSTTDEGLNSSSTILLSSTATDNVDLLLDVICSHSSQDIFLIGDTTVNCSSSDAAGNTDTCLLVVTVIDQELPNITCPADITVPNQPGEYYANVTWEDPVVSDNSGQFYTSENIPSGTLFPAGQTFWVKISAVDSSGNVANCLFNVTVIDDEAPVLTCPSDIIAYTLPGLPYAVIVIPSPNATDNSISGTQSGNDSILEVDIGSVTFTFEAVDLAGNQDNCSVMITVLDAEAPNITCPDDIIRNQTLGSSLTNASWPPPVIRDNSNFTTSPIAIPVSGSMFPIGSTVVNITTSDLHGNNATCTFTVTILVVSCSIPELPPRLSPMTSQCNAGLSINYTENCSYSCDVGYNLVGSASVTCLANTSLSDFLPQCEVETCNVPQLPPNLSSSCTEGQNVAYNTTCEFSCNIGYDLIGMPSLSCLANGTFSDDIPTCEIVACEVPRLPSNLLTPNVLCLGSVTYNTTCHFVCDVGYNLTGESSVTCLEDTTLSAPLPSCEVISCFIPDLQPRLSPLTSQCNGGLSINYTESCSYSCDVGYNLVGSPSVSCLANTSLSDLLPQCEVKTCDVPQLLPTLLTSCPMGQPIVYNTSCEFSCFSGYNITGTPSLDCLANGTLSGDIPTCQDINECLSFPCQNAAQCEDLIDNYYCVCEPGWTGDVCDQDMNECLSNPCVFGQCGHGINFYFCNCNAGYNGTNCNIVETCNVPQQPPNLSSSCTEGQNVAFNTTCEFSCNIGYDLIGMSSLECLANGTFSDDIPSCQIVTCPLPEVFSAELSSLSGNCDAGSSIDFETTCIFECSIGYTVIGGEDVTCQSDGELSAPIPTCAVVSCSIPELPPRLSPMSSQCDAGLSINYTESCSYSCDVGYNLVGSASVTCLANTSLSEFLPSCEVETCNVPQLPPNLSSSCMEGQNVAYNTTCAFSCNIGYDLIGGMSSLACLANGTFSDDILRCQIVTCNVPQLPPNISSSCTEGHNVAYNTTCEFSCNIGYDLIGGMSSLACLANGTFSDDILRCQIVTCTIPALPANLTTDNTQCGTEMRRDSNTSCIYECQPGYDLIGNSSVMCQDSGALSTDLPTCEVIDICQRFAPCPRVSTCTGGINSYECECNAGYTTVTDDRTPFTCVNINECAGSPQVCDSNALCRDLSGSYLCTCMEGFIGTGTSCEATEPCASSPCLNGGTCTTSDDGASYVCTCAESYTDVNCNTHIREQGPLAVVTNPLSQMVDVEARVTFSCSFRNARSYMWYKDSVPILGSENRSPLVINPALAEDQGYYYCTAVGEEGPPQSTNEALLTVNGVDNYVVMASFNKTFNSSLSDRTSSYFQQLSKELINFILTPLQNNFEATLAVAPNSFSPGSVMTEFGVYVYNGSIPDGEQLSIISSTITSLAEENPNFLDPASVQSFSTVTCPAGTYVTNYGYVAMFDSGVINSTANSTDTKCPDYTVNRDHRVQAFCDGDTIRACVWVPKMNCGGNLTADELLKIIQKDKVTAENAAMIVEEVAEITSMTETISTEGLEIVADILEDITDINSTDVQVTESVVDIASNIADLPEEELEMAEASGAPSRVVISLEAQLAVVEVLNETLRIVEPNIAAEVLDLTVDGLNQGITVFMSATADGGSISDEDFQVAEGDLTTEPDALEAQATLFIPSVLAKMFSGKTDRRMVITTHLNTALFRDSGLTELNLKVNQTGFLRKLNSRIIAASINNEEIENLEEPVMIAFTPLNPNGTNATCVSYDFDDNQWSPRGCNKTSNDSIDRITCECDHLTNFGILMDIYGGEELSPQADFILEIISYVGCCMSIWGLVITIFTYACNKKLRDRKPNQILLSLSSSLLCLYIVFLVMLSVDTERGKEEIPPLPCCILAGFLHYFTLSSLFWMGVEGYNMHILFVRVLNTYLPRFLRKASLFAWGVPMVIVGITGGAARQYYARTDFCFLEFWPLIGGLLIPVGFIMIFNVIIFIRVIIRLNRTVKGRQLVKTEKRQRLRRFQNAVCILILMGLTWSLGYLSIIKPASEVVQGIFTILNSLQGYFIFMLYCMRQPQVRRTWRSQFSCCLSKSFAASGSSSGQTNSTFKNSSARLRGQRGNQDARLMSNSDSSGFRPETIMRSQPERLPRAAYQTDGAEW